MTTYDGASASPDPSVPKPSKRPKQGKAKERTNGEGSIYKVTVKGREVWRAVATVAVVDGRQHKVYGSSPTRKQAIERLEANVLKWKVKEGLLPVSALPQVEPEVATDEDGELTVQQWLTRWLAERPVDGLAGSTRYAYQATIRNHLVPAIGSHKLSELTDAHIRVLMTVTLPNKRKADGSALLSSTAMRSAYFILKKALSEATKQSLISDNPCLRVDPPKRSRRPDENIAERKNEAKHILANLRDRVETVVQNRQASEAEKAKARADYLRWLLAFYGLRQSEALGLTDDCFDVTNEDESFLKVKQQLARRYKVHGCGEYNSEGKYPCGERAGIKCPQAKGESGLHIKRDTKTKSSERTIPLSKDVRTAYFSHHLAQQRFRLSDSFDPIKGMETLTFTSKTGKPRKHQADNKAWRELLDELGLDHIRGHVARHITVSILAEQNVPASIIKLIVGHSDEIAQQTYTHLSSEAMRKPLQNLGSMLGLDDGGESQAEKDGDAKPSYEELLEQVEQLKSLLRNG